MEELILRLLADTDKTRDRYEAILAESQTGTVYQTMAWLSVFQSLSAQIVFVEVDKETLVPFVCKGRGMLRRAYSLPFDTYGGPVATKRNDLVSFERVMEQLGFPSTRVVDYSQRMRTGNGRTETATTHIVEIGEGYDRVYAAYSEANKRVLRQASERGVRVLPMYDDSELGLFYRLYTHTVSKYNVWPFPLDFFRALYQRMVPRGLACFYLAWHNGEAVAGNLVLRFNGEACDWMWVYDQARRELRATNAVIDHSIREEIERGAYRFNLGASPDDRLGSVRFKKSFGASEYRYNIFTQTLWS